MFECTVIWHSIGRDFLTLALHVQVSRARIKMPRDTTEYLFVSFYNTMLVKSAKIKDTLFCLLKM